MAKLFIKDIRPNPDQPRTVFKQAPLEELAASIVANGLLQPITVRLITAGPGDQVQYEIVAGERRYRAHILAGLDTIEANIVYIDQAERDILAIIENLQRENITPVEEGKAYQKILDTGVKVDDLAAMLGLKQPWRITERTSLLALAPTFLDLLEKGHLTSSQGSEMARLQHRDQQTLFDLIRRGRCDTFVKLRLATDGLLAAAAQAGFWAEQKTSESETKSLTSFESKIEQIVKMVANGFSDGEIVVLRKIKPGRAEVVAAQLALIGKHLKLMEKELQMAIIQGDLLATG